MKIKSFVTETPDYLRFGLGVLAFSVCFLFAVPETARLLDPGGLIFVAWQVLPAAFWLKYRGNIPVIKTIIITAIPAGIMGTAIGFHSITYDSMPLEDLGAAASIMVSTIVFAGYFALVAYAFRDKNNYKISAVDPVTVLPCFIAIISPIYIALRGSTELGHMILSDYVSPKVLILFFGVIVLLLAGSALSNVARILAEASIIGIILSIVVALVVWFRGITVSTIPKDATDIATLGLLYGTFLFMMSYYLSLLTGETDEINFDIKNWHLIESAALYILLVFAPPSIFEIAT